MREPSRRAARRTTAAVLSAILVSTAVLSTTSCDAGFLFDIWDELLTPGLDVSPSAAVLEAGQHLTLTAVGGRGPYTFLKTGGTGTLTDHLDGTADYLADGGATTASILLSDSRGEEVLASVRVSAAPIPQLYILPSSASLSYGDPVPFGVSGGASPYVFSLVSGAGALTDNGDGTADYTAPATDTDAVVQVEDGSGQASQASVTVRAAPQLLIIVPDTLVIEVNKVFTFSAAGGTGTYNFSASAGSMNAATGQFTAPAAPASVTVSVDDSVDTAVASVDVIAAAGLPLTIVPRSVNVTMGSTFQFEAEGGDGTYVFSMGTTYGGTITPSGLYSALSDRQGVETVIVTDGRGITNTATVKVKKK